MASPKMPGRSRAFDREVSDLLPLFEFSTVVNSSLDLEFILQTVLRTLMGKMLVAKGMVLLRQEDGAFSVIVAKGLGPEMLQRRLVVERVPRRTTGIRELGARGDAIAELMRETEQSLLVPIRSHSSVVGLITLGRRMTKLTYSLVERRLLESLVHLSGAAIEKAIIVRQVQEANRRLDRKIQELNTLFDLGKEFNVGLDQARVVRLLTFALLGQVGVKSYAICLREDDEPKVVASKLPADADLAPDLHPLCTLEQAATVQELSRHRNSRVSAARLMQNGIQAVVPMRSQGETKGLLLLGERHRAASYTAEDFEFLYSLGNLALVSIENARLFQDALERQRLEDELTIAREIQQGLLPGVLPTIPGIDVAAVNIPSKAVGGDYYDLLPRSDGSVVLAIGDVSGKGTPASLLMASVQAALRALAPDCRSLAETTGRINDLTFANTKGAGRFITFFWGTLSEEGHSLAYVNAGHNAPILLRADGSVEFLEEGGLILGVFATGAAYREGRAVLRSDDALVLFTDGVTEAMNGAGDQFGDDRLLETIKESRQGSAADILRHVQDAVQAFVGATPQSDDITLLVLKKRP